MAYLVRTIARPHQYLMRPDNLVGDTLSSPGNIGAAWVFPTMRAAGDRLAEAQLRVAPLLTVDLSPVKAARGGRAVLTAPAVAVLRYFGAGEVRQPGGWWLPRTQRRVDRRLVVELVGAGLIERGAGPGCDLFRITAAGLAEIGRLTPCA